MSNSELEGKSISTIADERYLKGSKLEYLVQFKGESETHWHKASDLKEVKGFAKAKRNHTSASRSASNRKRKADSPVKSPTRRSSSRSSSRAEKSSTSPKKKVKKTPKKAVQKTPEKVEEAASFVSSISQRASSATREASAYIRSMSPFGRLPKVSLRSLSPFGSSPRRRSGKREVSASPSTRLTRRQAKLLDAKDKITHTSTKVLQEHQHSLHERFFNFTKTAFYYTSITGVVLFAILVLYSNVE